MKQFTLGILLGTVAMFIFGAVFWMTPFPYRVLPGVADEAAAGKTLKALFPENGTYLIPNPAAEPKQHAELAQTGPIATVHIQRQGMQPMEPRVLLQGFIHELVVVALLALILKIALPALGGYLSRVVLVTMLGVTTAVYSNFSMPIWWQHPWPYYLVSCVYDLGAWVAAGLVLAAFIKPATDK
jgi:hypothetical protein